MSTTINVHGILVHTISDVTVASLIPVPASVGVGVVKSSGRHVLQAASWHGGDALRTAGLGAASLSACSLRLAQRRPARCRRRMMLRGNGPSIAIGSVVPILRDEFHSCTNGAATVVQMSVPTGANSNVTRAPVVFHVASSCTCVGVVMTSSLSALIPADGEAVR